MTTIKIKRIYEDPSDHDGCSILIDRVWPRGVSKEGSRLDDWHKDIAPTEKLRKWFDHNPRKFNEFARRYRKELDFRKEDLTVIRKKAKDKTITLLYGAKDTEHNQAVVLQEVLLK